MSAQEDGAPSFEKSSKKNALGSKKVLFYGQAIDRNLLMSLNTIAIKQYTITEITTKLCMYLSNYCTTFLDTQLTYHTGEMIFHIHTDASFLSKPVAKSRAGGYFFHLTFYLIQQYVPTIPQSFFCATFFAIF